MPAADYYNYYQSQQEPSHQSGGGLRVFRGGPQGGAGIGDVFRKVFRFMVPVAKSFASNTIQNVSSGMPLASAAKAAIQPTLSTAAAPLVSRFINTVAPSAAAANAAASSAANNGDAAAQSGSGAVLFSGYDGVPTTNASVKQYKRSHHGSSGGKAAGKKRKTTATLQYNF